MTTAHPELAAAGQVLEVKAGAGLNVEALEVTQDHQQLLIGFRGPCATGARSLRASRIPVACSKQMQIPR
ncbi:hypothetical protein QTI66_34670 [Variovorax sp. J22R133]|uniref:hypothetical protein n=1 Tax=Variovorax brevis TaxID=3053503 RepID=UPI002578CA92|nr:hypothetical protein [Variovorax sp. J22R133]MDM0117266.1 hypothetical protein [Variovorax sp. J22R133]